MRVHRLAVVPVAALALVMAACAPTAPTPGASSETTAESLASAPDGLVGNYSVEYRTTESDHDAITDEVIVRNVEVTGSCSGSQCDLTLTTELKAPDGSTSSVSTALSFEGTEYRGTQTTAFSCDGMTSLTTVEDGLEYTSETTITNPITTPIEDRLVVESFDIVTVERNEITAAGREAGCLKINFSGPDPYVSGATTVGVGTRLP